MKAIRNFFISLFVIVWIVVFHYESIRYFYLDPYVRKHHNIQKLPKLKFLFPPAGWIMFYSVSPSAGNVEVYGVKGKLNQLIDPHDVFPTRTIGYDNIHRGILSVAGDRRNGQSFCNYLNQRFDYFDEFIVTYSYFPDVTKEYFQRYQNVLYRCEGKK